MQRVAVLHGMSPTVVWKRPTGAHGPYERTSELNAVLRARHKWQSQAVGPGFADEALEGVNQKCFAILALHPRDITTEHGLSFQLQVRLAAGATLASRRPERRILFLEVRSVGAGRPLRGEYLCQRRIRHEPNVPCSDGCGSGPARNTTCGALGQQVPRGPRARLVEATSCGVSKDANRTSSARADKHAVDVSHWPRHRAHREEPLSGRTARPSIHPLAFSQGLKLSVYAVVWDKVFASGRRAHRIDAAADSGAGQAMPWAPKISRGSS